MNKSAEKSEQRQVSPQETEKIIHLANKILLLRVEGDLSNSAVIKEKPPSFSKNFLSLNLFPKEPSISMILSLVSPKSPQKMLPPLEPLLKPASFMFLNAKLSTVSDEQTSLFQLLKRPFSLISLLKTSQKKSPSPSWMATSILQSSIPSVSLFLVLSGRELSSFTIITTPNSRASLALSMNS